MRQGFYLVWNPSTGYTKYRHQSRKLAQAEAERMARNNRDQEFIVLSAVASVKISDVVSEDFDYPILEEDIPF